MIKTTKLIIMSKQKKIEQKAGEIKESLKTIANDFSKILKTEKIKPNELHLQIDVETALYECKSMAKIYRQF